MTTKSVTLTRLRKQFPGYTWGRAKHRTFVGDTNATRVLVYEAVVFAAESITCVWMVRTHDNHSGETTSCVYDTWNKE